MGELLDKTLREAGIDPATGNPLAAEGNSPENNQQGGNQDGQDNARQQEQQGKTDDETDNQEARGDGNETNRPESSGNEGAEDEVTALTEGLSDEEFERLVEKLTANSERGMVQLPKSMLNKIKRQKREAQTKYENELAETNAKAKAYELMLNATKQTPAQHPEQRQPVQEEIPDRELEPERYALYMTDKLVPYVQSLEQRLASREQEDAVSGATRELQALEGRRTAQHPEYPEAKEAWVKMQVKQIKTLKPDFPDGEARRRVEAAFLQHSVQLAANGVDPTKYLLDIMEGLYTPKAAKKAEEKKPSGKPDLDALARAIQKNKSLSQMNGQAPGGGDEVPDQVAYHALSQAEQIKVLEKVGGFRGLVKAWSAAS
jgi:hypothetical protein